MITIQQLFIAAACLVGLVLLAVFTAAWGWFFYRLWRSLQDFIAAVGELGKVAESFSQLPKLKDYRPVIVKALQSERKYTSVEALADYLVEKMMAFDEFAEMMGITTAPAWARQGLIDPPPGQGGFIVAATEIPADALMKAPDISQRLVPQQQLSDDEVSSLKREAVNAYTAKKHGNREVPQSA
jgi:hypothetical protein